MRTNSLNVTDADMSNIFHLFLTFNTNKMVSEQYMKEMIKHDID